MDKRDDFRSMLPFLPVILRSSTVLWTPSVVEALESLSKGPSHSNVSSGKIFAQTIAELHISLGFPALHASTSLGFSLFFDDMMKKDEAKKWFGEVIPRLAELMLRLPTLLEAHYQNAVVFNGMETTLRVLEPQKPGIVFLSQELIAALMACGLFCFFPAAKRGGKKPRPINFDNLFVCLYQRKKANQENKIKCLVHYFQRVSSNMPTGNVSFERKVLSLTRNNQYNFVCPEVDFWSKSNVPLCRFEVHTYGKIEDQSTELLEVDFSDKHIGGLVLKQGCVQEEIRFAINPELIASILFLPVTADNESIEFVGAERFSKYTGYRASFLFSGDHKDEKSIDTMKRRRTRVIAIDAMRNPGDTQFRTEGLLREVNKAFCGFRVTEERRDECGIGVATGNWGCGVFGGDPGVKAVIQWLAASQAMRPFVLYYSFGLKSLSKLQSVVQWVESQKWSVGEVWRKVVTYGDQRVRGETTAEFLKWLNPSLFEDGSGDIELAQARPGRGRGMFGAQKPASAPKKRAREQDQLEVGISGHNPTRKRIIEAIWNRINMP